MSSSEDVACMAPVIKAVGYCSRKTAFGNSVLGGTRTGPGSTRVAEHSRGMFRDSMAPEGIHLNCSCQLVLLAMRQERHTAYTRGTFEGLVELDGEVGCQTVLSRLDLFAAPRELDGIIAHESFRVAVAADGPRYCEQSPGQGTEGHT